MRSVGASISESGNEHCEGEERIEVVVEGVVGMNLRGVVGQEAANSTLLGLSTKLDVSSPIPIFITLESCLKKKKMQ